MTRNVIFFAWNRSVPGREQVSSTHFDEFVGYLRTQAADGTIQGFDVVFLNAHGGDLNGFFLIKGDPDKLAKLVASDAWTEHMTRAAIHLEGSGSIGGVTGDQAQSRMEVWRRNLPA